jgi:hypothetical protein
MTSHNTTAGSTRMLLALLSEAEPLACDNLNSWCAIILFVTMCGTDVTDVPWGPHRLSEHAGEALCQFA